MATSGGINNWIKNAAKSMGYGFKDAFKTYNPVLSNMIEETKDTKDQLFSDISDLRQEFRISEERTLVQELKESTKDVFKNLWEDVTTGNLYNKDRQKAADNMMASALGFDLSDFEFDASDFDDWGDDDWTADDSAKAEVAQSVKNTAATIRGMDIVGEKISTSVSAATVESSRQVVKATRDGSKALYALNSKGFNNISQALMQLNDNVVSFAKVTEPMTQHYNNATIFFTKTTETLEKIEQHLAHMDNRANEKEMKYFDKGIGDIMGADTGISVNALYELAKKNLKDDAWILDLAKDGMKNIRNMKLQGNSIGDSLPVGVWITKAITNVMIPKIFSQAMKDMNKAIADFSGAAILNLRDSKFLDKIDPYGLVKQYLLPSTNTKMKINTSNYEKGAISWDGVSKKALVEVIPEYLSMIYGSLSGKHKKYDFNRGKFIDFGSISEDIKQGRITDATRAGGGYYDDALEMAIKQGIKKEDAEKMLQRYFYNAVFGTDEQRKLAFQVNSGDFTEENRTTLGIDKKTLEVLQSTLNDYIRIMNKPVYQRTEKEREKERNFNKARVATEHARNTYADEMTSEEISGISNMRYLLNGGTDIANIFSSNKNGVSTSTTSGEFTSVGQNINDIAYAVKNVIPNYLQLMLYELNGHTNYMVWDFKKNGRMLAKKKPRYYKGNQLTPMLRVSGNVGKESKTKSNKKKDKNNSSDDAAAAQDIERSYDINLGDLYAEEANPSSADTAEDKKEKSKFGKFVTSIGGKIKDFFGRWKTKDPTKAGTLLGGISNILNAVSYSVNTMFMGTSDDDRDNNGLIHVLKTEVKNIFSGFTKFYEDFLKNHLESIGDKIKDLFDKNETFTDLKQKAKNFFNDSKNKAIEWAGGTIEEMIYGTKEAKQRKFDRDTKKYDADLKKYEELVKTLMAKSTQDNPIDEAKARQTASQQIFRTDKPENAKPVAPKFAYGTNYVPKTGLAILSEGEMVIPSELNPFYNRPTNKANQIAKEKNIEKKYFGRFSGGVKAAGVKATNMYANKADILHYLREKGFENLSAKEFKDYINSLNERELKELEDEIFKDKALKGADDKELRRKRHYAEDIRNVFGKDVSWEEIEELLNSFQSFDEAEDFATDAKIEKNTKEMGGLKKIMYGGLAKSVHKAGRAFENSVNGLLEGDNENKRSLGDLKEKIGKVTDSIFDKDQDKRHKNAVNAGAGAILGAGVSILTGAVVGPLFGAALGAGVGLLHNNVKLQQTLFGDDNIDDEGNYIGDGKTFKSKIAKFLKQQLPDTLKGGGVGALAGAFLGHPLLGAVVGSGIGFVKNSETAKDILFGEMGEEGRKGGVIPKSVQDLVKKGLPKALVGGALGLLAGPFGALLPNLVLGAGLGLYTQTEEFSEKFFGKDGDKKSQKESFVGLVKDRILKNVDELGHNAKNMLKSFFKSLGIGVKSKLRTVADWMKDKLENPKSPLGKVLTFLPRTLLGAGKAVVKGIGKPLEIANEKFQNYNLKNGIDVYSRNLKRNRTAAERISLRTSKGIKSDLYSDVDSVLSTVNKDQFDEFKSALDLMKEAKTSEEKNYLIESLLNSDKFEGDEKKKALMSNILRSKDGTGFISEKELQKIIDLAETEEKNVDWESRVATETIRYQHTMTDVVTRISDNIEKFWLGGERRTDELKEGFEYRTDSNGNRHIVQKTTDYIRNDNFDVSYQGNGNQILTDKNDGSLYVQNGVNGYGDRIFVNQKTGEVVNEKDERFFKKVDTIKPVTDIDSAYKTEHVKGFKEHLQDAGNLLGTAAVAPFMIGGKAVQVVGNGIYNTTLNGIAGGVSEIELAKAMAEGKTTEEALNSLDSDTYNILNNSGKLSQKMEAYDNQRRFFNETTPEVKIAGLDAPVLQNFIDTIVIQWRKNNELNEQLKDGLKKAQEVLERNTKAMEENTKAEEKSTKESDKSSPMDLSNVVPQGAARGGIFHVSSKVPFAGNFSALPYWGNYGLGDFVAGIGSGIKNAASNAWQGVKNVGAGLLKGAATVGVGAYAGAKAVQGIQGVLSKAIGAGKKAKDTASALLGLGGQPDVNISGAAGGSGGGGGESMETESSQGKKIITVFDSNASPHQYIKKADGELEEVTNDKETDASNARLDATSSNIANIPVISSILVGMSRTLSRIAAKTGGGSGEGGGEGGSGEGGDGKGGIGNALKTAGIAAGAGGLLASAKALVSNIGVPLAGVLGLTGGLDKVGESVGNSKLFRSNDTKSVFSGKAVMIGGHQVEVDEHGDPIVNSDGLYTTLDGNYIDPSTGGLYDGEGNAIGGVDVTDVQHLGSDNTVQGSMWRNIGVRTIMNAEKGAGLAKNLLGGIGRGKSLAGSMLFGRHGQNVAHALFGGRIERGWLATRLGKKGYNVKGIIPSIHNSRIATGIRNGIGKAGNGIRNFGSRIANSKAGMAVRNAFGKAGNAVKGVADDVAAKISTVLDDIFAKIIKSFEDGKLSKLIPQKVRAKIGKFFKAIEDKLAPILTKEAGASGAKSLANQLDDILVALKIPLIVGAAVDGWGNAPTYLGVVTPYQELPTECKFSAAVLNALNMAIPVIGGLIPTKVFYNVFYEAAHLVFGGAGWTWLDNWAEDRAEAEQIVAQYNEENGTALSIEEYNQMMGNAGCITMMGQSYVDDMSQLKNTLGNEIKNEGLLGTMGEIGKGFTETLKTDGIGKMLSDTVEESFFAQGMKGVNNGLSNAVEEGVANGNVAATAYDKMMTAAGDAIVWGGDKLNDMKNWLSGGRSGLPAGKGTSSKNFVSQLDPKYNGMKIGTSTVNENGCAPAVASMVAGEYGKKFSMQQAANKANNYQEGANGTTINYFGDALAEQGIGTGILPNMQQVLGNLKQGNSVILLGQDPNNSDKANSPFGPSNHYVLASGVDKSGRLIIKDPENTKPVLYDPSILGSTTMAIGTSYINPSQRIKPHAMIGGTVKRRSIIGSAVSGAKKAVSSVRNAGKNLLNNAKAMFGSIFGGGSKGQAYPAEIWSWLHQEMGLNDFQTAAVMGCFECESGNSPYCIEGYYLSGFPGYEAVASNEGMDNFVVNVLFPAYDKKGTKINKEAYKHDDGHYYPGIGLPQWTGSRSYELYKFARENGKNWFDLQTQLDYLKKEFTSSYSGTISKLKASSNIEDATEIFAVKFENGNFKKGTDAYNKRLNAAKNIYNTYSNQPLADVSNLESSEYKGDSEGKSNNGNFLSTLASATGLTTAASNIKNSISGAIGKSDGGILDQINSIFSAALGGIFGIGSNKETTGEEGTEGSSSGYYDSEGNWVSTSGANLGALANLDGPNRLVEIAKGELGYQEKASNSQLDDPHANVGSANWTKYGAFSGANGAAWCGSFVSWLFNQVVGGDKEKMLQLFRTTDGNLPRSMAAVANILDLANKTGSFTKEPQKGDVVIYGTSHTGIVSSVNEDGTFNTIEGNTSGTPAGFDRDGGVVAAKTNRPLNDPKLTGFLRPDWNAVFPPSSGEPRATYAAKDFYAEPGSVYIDPGKFRTPLPADRIEQMKSQGTLYDYALKNEPQAIGYVNKNIVSKHSSSIFGNIPTDAVQGVINSKINDNTLGTFIHEKMPTAIGYVNTDKIMPKGGMPADVFNNLIDNYKASGDYSRWVLDNYSNAVTFAGKGSGINNYVSKKYQTNRATRALNNWVKPVVNTDTSASVSNTYAGKGSSATQTRVTQPTIKINTGAAADIARNIAQNSKSNNVNYEELLGAIIKLLNAIVQNTGDGGSIYNAIATYLPAGSNVTKEDIESLAKISTSAAKAAVSAKVDTSGMKNTGNMYNVNRGVRKVRGDLAKVQYMG